MYASTGRSRYAEKPRRPESGSDRAAFAAPYGQAGYVHHRRRRNTATITHDSAYKSDSSVEENSFSLEFGRSSCKKTSGKRIQSLVDEEVSKEIETRHPSPSVIARLMGLDTLPPPQIACKRQKDADACSQAVSSTGIQGKFVPSKENFCLKNTNEDQEFKDIFEVMDTAKFKKCENQSTRKAKLTFKGSKTDMDFIRQKFMDVKRLSTDEALQNSKEFDDALEILHSNKDLFLKFLQDPDSLFMRHLQEVNHVSYSPHPTQITVLKSSNGDNYGNTRTSESKSKDGRYSHMHKEVGSSFRKPATRPISRSLSEYSSVPRRLSTPLYTGKAEAHTHPTRIVVLKPSLERSHKVAGPLSSSHENLRIGSRKHRESALSTIQESYTEGRDKPKFSENVGHLRHKAKGSRETAKGTARQIRHAIGSHSKSPITSELKTCVQNESSCISSDLAKLNNSESFCQFPDHFDAWINEFCPSCSCSTESSFSREARKHMSERLKITQQFEVVGLAARDMSTLAEMIAFSCRETPDTIGVSLGSKKVLDDKFAGDEILGGLDCRSTISDKDGLRDGNSKKLRKSKSLPAASTAHRSPKVGHRKQDGNGTCYILKDVIKMDPDEFSDASFSKNQKSFVRGSVLHANKPRQPHPVGEENKLPELEIHVPSEELQKSIYVRDLPEEKLLHPEHHDEHATDRKHLIDTPLVPICVDEPSPLTPNEQSKRSVMRLTPENKELSSHSHNDIMNEEDSTRHPQVDPLQSQSETFEAGLTLSSKESELPSPVSVLEPPSQEQSSCSGCFERISADLQELRMQLSLLKVESAERYEEESGIILSSDVISAGDCQTYLRTREIHQTFMDEDDRDFSYLLDILSDSGIHGANQERVSDVFNSLDYPVDPHVFDKLETKYSMVSSWSGSERKLLFDLVNCSLVGTIAPHIDLHPWVRSKKSMHTWEPVGLVERLWEMVVKQRKELGCNLEDKILDPRWLDVEDDMDVIVKEIEKMLNNDLWEETVAEFIIG
ncbi:unnamed protein product [Musa acuminata subsp. malaccensis]|uniref:(wild Malaysian banana) hypothetical protein n=1 Tax=Musa acuminata subsp. malaccensis TaxID=214687 RepID=A0A8D6ZW75_MUSAM|nr:PREDICTED: uncharacterized protein LOC103984388 isoform X1 [Musa acuminata subsp. malaccensis]CAG1837753.1 unnamed protein product [Musa acuminata subsp. malaccensis]